MQRIYYRFILEGGQEIDEVRYGVQAMPWQETARVGVVIVRQRSEDRASSANHVLSDTNDQHARPVLRDAVVAREYEPVPDVVAVFLSWTPEPTPCS